MNLPSCRRGRRGCGRGFANPYDTQSHVFRGLHGFVVGGVGVLRARTCGELNIFPVLLFLLSTRAKNPYDPYDPYDNPSNLLILLRKFIVGVKLKPYDSERQLKIPYKGNIR